MKKTGYGITQITKDFLIPGDSAKQVRRKWEQQKKEM